MRIVVLIAVSCLCGLLGAAVEQLIMPVLTLGHGGWLLFSDAWNLMHWQQMVPLVFDYGLSIYSVFCFICVCVEFLLKKYLKIGGISWLVAVVLVIIADTLFSDFVYYGGDPVSIWGFFSHNFLTLFFCWALSCGMNDHLSGLYVRWSFTTAGCNVSEAGAESLWVSLKLHRGVSWTAEAFGG